MAENNDEIKKKIITISKLDSIKSNKEGLEVIIGFNIYNNENGKEVKYTLWQTKQDGSMTKAFSQFKGQQMMIGSSVGIAYKEAPNNFQFKDRVTGEMKQATSTNRTIMWFSEPSNIEEYDDALSKIGSSAQDFSPNNAPVRDLGQEVDEFPIEDRIDVKSIPFNSNPSKL